MNEGRYVLDVVAFIERSARTIGAVELEPRPSWRESYYEAMERLKQREEILWGGSASKSRRSAATAASAS